MELKDYWNTIRHRWKVILLCLFVSVGLAGFLTWQATPQYASSARIFIATTDAGAETGGAYQSGLFATQRASSYADLVGNRQLAERVNEALGGALDPDALADRVSARVVPDTVILQITATDPDPARARDIAQAYANGLSSLVTELETPSGKTNALDQGVDRRQRPHLDRPRSRPSPCATSAWPSCWACSSASVSQCSASSWTPPSRPPRTSPR